MANATPGERASWPQLTINYVGHRQKWFLASLERGSCVPLLTSRQWCQLTEFGQEVNKIRERLAQPWSLAEQMCPPPPPFKASGNLLPAHNTPASFTAGTRIPTEREEGRQGQKTSVFHSELIRSMTRLWVSPKESIIVKNRETGGVRPALMITVNC